MHSIAAAEAARHQEGSSALALTQRLLGGDGASGMSKQEVKARKAIAVICERLSMLAQALAARTEAGRAANGGIASPAEGVTSDGASPGRGTTPRRRPGSKGGQRRRSSGGTDPGKSTGGSVWSASWTGTALEVSVERTYSAPIAAPDGSSSSHGKAASYKRSWLQNLGKPADPSHPKAKKKHLTQLKDDLQAAVAAAEEWLLHGRSSGNRQDASGTAGGRRSRSSRHRGSADSSSKRGRRGSAASSVSASASRGKTQPGAGATTEDEDSRPPTPVRRSGSGFESEGGQSDRPEAWQAGNSVQQDDDDDGDLFGDAAGTPGGGDGEGSSSKIIASDSGRKRRD